MFKVGDRVRRTSGSYAGMVSGDVGTVTEVCQYQGIRILEFDTKAFHNDEKFVKASSFKGNTK